MALGFLNRLLGSYSDKVVKRHTKRVAVINGLEAELERLSEAELRAKTDAFKARLADGESLEDLLPEAFAVVREAAKRTLGQRHYDVQLIGGMVLHEGNVAEMKTGEGKTLVATLPTYLNALTGRGVHVVTVNDYLARRDSEWMGQIYRYLGLSVGLIVHGLSPAERQEAYGADITYGTNNEFGFDYLRDNMVLRREEMVQRPLNYAIIDEADSILIDEARTPLIISGSTDKPVDRYYVFAKLVERLQPEVDYTVDEKARTIAPSEEGIAKVEKALNLGNIYDDESGETSHFLHQAIKARALFKRDRDYVVKDGQVIIVDEFTGRLMFGRRYSEGLHQAIEAKEGVKIERETQTLATITIQNYFRIYKKLAGMTGTAITEEEEFRKIYRMDVIVIPTHRPLVRKDHPDVVYKSVKAKFNAVVDEIVDCHQRGQPVLVGTVSIEKSETLSAMLGRRGVTHQVLNAKFHEKEAEIVAQAGRFQAVTIATNMAGRGTDILLGGNPAFMAKQKMRSMGHDEEMITRASEGLPSDEPETAAAQQTYRQLLAEHEAVCRQEREKVLAAGGLHIVGTERHEARRIDNQLRGRSGRQGDPGSSRFFVALEDDLMRLFGGEMVSGLMDRLGIEEDTPIDSPIVSRAIEGAQKKVEARNFDIRKHVLQYDDVMNQQRELIYAQRRKILQGENLQESLLDMTDKLLQGLVGQFCPGDADPEDWNLAALIEQAEQVCFPPGVLTAATLLQADGPAAVHELLCAAARQVYAEKETRLGAETMRDLEKVALLRTVDEKWMEHLANMDQLRDGINLRAYGQRDPLVEYKFEATDMFNEMVQGIQETAVRLVYKLEVVRRPEQRQMHAYGPGQSDAAPANKTVRVKDRVGRNDPCPCGSGKKYKKCCGTAQSA